MKSLRDNIMEYLWHKIKVFPNQPKDEFDTEADHILFMIDTAVQSAIGSDHEYEHNSFMEKRDTTDTLTKRKIRERWKELSK